MYSALLANFLHGEFFHLFYSRGILYTSFLSYIDLIEYFWYSICFSCIFSYIFLFLKWLF